MQPPALPPRLLDQAFPFHVATDASLRVVRVGPSLRRLLPSLSLGQPLSQHFTVVRPEVELTRASLVASAASVLVLATRDGRVQLKAQLVEGDDGTVFLLATPWVTGMPDLERLGLSLADFALHDPLVDVLLIMHTQELALGEARALAQRLSSQRAELRAANRRLAAQYGATRALEGARSEAEAVPAVLDAITPSLQVTFAAYVSLQGPPTVVCCRRSSGVDADGPTLSKGTAFDDGGLLASLEDGLPVEVDRSNVSGGLLLAAITALGAQGLLGAMVRVRGRDHAMLLLGAASVQELGQDVQYLAADLGARLGQTIERLDAEAKLREHARRLEAQSLELSAARDAALEASRLKSAFVAGVSHELRTPLSGIVGVANLLADAPLSPQLRDLVKLLRTSADNLHHIIDDILDLSKLEAGRLRIEAVEHSPLELVEEVVAHFGSAAEARRIDLACDAALDTAARALGDPTRVRQIVANLLSNALKFTERGGVRVRVWSARDRGGHRLCIEVHDSGIGIDPSARASLFQPFVQADGSITRKYGGTGLGLAISRQLAELMGGSLDVESEPGRGSTFTLVVPMVELPSEARARIEGSALVLVDQPVSRQVACSALSSLGLRTSETPSDAIELVAERCPDVVVLAIDGERALERLAALQRVPALRIVAIVPQGPAEPGVLAALDERTEALPRPLRASMLWRAVAVLGGAQPRTRISARFAPHAETPPPGSRGRVLVAEDDAVNQIVTATSLQKLGFDVVVASKGDDALALASSQRFDALVLDAHMPGRDGLEVARAVRRLPGELGQVRILGLSASVLAEDRARCLAAGMDDFISKPASLATLDLALPRSTSVRPSPLPEAPRLDEGIVDDILALDGGEGGVLRELLVVFERSMVGRLAALPSLTGDAAAAVSELHAMRGAGAAIGASALSAAAQALEQAAREGLPPARADIDHLTSLVDEALVLLRARIPAG